MIKMYSASKRDGIQAYLRTNLGLELFDNLISYLDLVSWQASSIPLEHISPTLKIGNGFGFSDDYLEYRQEISSWGCGLLIDKPNG
jgi:hypothetical protein